MSLYFSLLGIGAWSWLWVIISTVYFALSQQNLSNKKSLQSNSFPPHQQNLGTFNYCNSFSRRLYSISNRTYVAFHFFVLHFIIPGTPMYPMRGPFSIQGHEKSVFCSFHNGKIVSCILFHMQQPVLSCWKLHYGTILDFQIHKKFLFLSRFFRVCFRKVLILFNSVFSH